MLVLTLYLLLVAKNERANPSYGLTTPEKLPLQEVHLYRNSPSQGATLYGNHAFWCSHPTKPIAKPFRNTYLAPEWDGVAKRRGWGERGYIFSDIGKPAIASIPSWDTNAGNEKRNIYVAATLTRRNDDNDGHWNDGLVNVDNEPTNNTTLLQRSIILCFNPFRRVVVFLEAYRFFCSVLDIIFQ